MSPPHGVTLSAQQRDFIDKRIAERGLGDRVTVGLTDYRDLPAGEYDAVSTVEMGEHVGEGRYPEYARILFDSLRPGGRLLLQQMSRKGDAAPGGGAFIERYIAPDMHMRPLPSTMAYLEGAGFELRDVQALREHYVTTVEHWLQTLESRRSEFVAAHRRRRSPGLAALPRRRRPGLRAGPDGRRPDPRAPPRLGLRHRGEFLRRRPSPSPSPRSLRGCCSCWPRPTSVPGSPGGTASSTPRGACCSWPRPGPRS